MTTLDCGAILHVDCGPILLARDLASYGYSLPDAELFLAVQQLLL